MDREAVANTICTPWSFVSNGRSQGPHAERRDPAAYHRAMQVEILASPSFSFATVTITPSTAVHVEAGAMAAYSDGVEVETKARGGVMAGLRRSVLGGESF